MISAALRKARQVLEDPVLRRWLLRRVVGLERSPPAFVVGHPPYLGADGDGVPAEPGALAVAEFAAGRFSPPSASVRIDLAGTSVDLTPENPAVLFAQPYDDLETLLAAHRFAWVPVAGSSVAQDWVAVLWQSWVSRFGDDPSGWPWHAYTAAERAINIIDFSRRFGVPGDLDETSQILARHAAIIRQNLEYFGDHYTSNHLSNNGRGLLRLGTALGRADHADTGAQIMVAEAGRIFGRSGVLREGSTHYHLLVTRNYIDAWLDARAAELDAAALLRDIAQRALAAIPGLCLPGGMPLIGDISPDIPPARLGRFIGAAGDEGWLASLPDDRQHHARDLISTSAAVSPDKLAEDGWHRFGGHRWQALAFVPPNGWPPMPGHGHQDLGSFELHDGERPVIVDPGRGSYNDMEYAGAQSHNYLTVDGVAPTAVNRPYYSDEYRDRVIGAGPKMARTGTGSKLTIAGFGRIRGIGTAVREWRFLEDRVEILDRVEGLGTHHLQRRFHTPAESRLDMTGAILEFEGAAYSLSADCQPAVTKSPIFAEYGRDRSGYQVMFDQTVSLPFESKIVIARI